MKNIIKLSIISETESKNHAVLKVANGLIVMRGNEFDGYDFECGGCQEVLVKDAFYQQIRNIVFVCNKCGKFNLIKFDWKVYVLVYIKEKVDVAALAVGFLLTLIVSSNQNNSTQTKIFLDILIFILSLNYKFLVQVFQEKQ